MTREEITENWPILGHFATLKKTSQDDSNKLYMTESSIEVIDFDKIPKEFSRGKGWKGVPKSSDALYIDSSSWTFIEFKNGNIEKSDVHRKIYDSIIMLLELKILPDFDYVRKNIRYILVYNKERYGRQKPSGLTTFQKYVQDRAEEELRLFELDKLNDYLLAEVHTYTPEEFERNFVCPTEALIVARNS